MCFGMAVRYRLHHCCPVCVRYGHGGECRAAHDSRKPTIGVYAKGDGVHKDNIQPLGFIIYQVATAKLILSYPPSIDGFFQQPFVEYRIRDTGFAGSQE